VDYPLSWQLACTCGDSIPGGTLSYPGSDLIQLLHDRRPADAVDCTIDPATTRRWLVTGLDSAPPVIHREGKKHGWVDTW